MSKLLRALMPTHAAILEEQECFAVGYTWQDPAFGELEGRTVVFGRDAQAAAQSFHSRHRHLSRVWVLPGRGHGETAPSPEPQT